MTAERTKDSLERLQGACFSLRAGLEKIEGIQRELDWDAEHPDDATTTPESRELIRGHINTILGSVLTGNSAQIEAIRQELITQEDIVRIEVDNRGEV